MNTSHTCCFKKNVALKASRTKLHCLKTFAIYIFFESCLICREQTSKTNCAIVIYIVTRFERNFLFIFLFYLFIIYNFLLNKKKLYWKILMKTTYLVEFLHISSFIGRSKHKSSSINPQISQ